MLDQSFVERDMDQTWEPYVTVVMSVIGGSEYERKAVRDGIISDFGPKAWESILSEALERWTNKALGDGHGNKRKTTVDCH